MLLVLRDLDNQDKHHLQIKPQIEKTAISSNNEIEFESEDEVEKNIPPNITLNNPPFIDGEIILIHLTFSRIVKVKGNYNISARLEVELPNGKRMGLTECLGAIGTYTEIIINYLSTIN